MKCSNKNVFVAVLASTLALSTGCAVEDAPMGYYIDKSPSADNVGVAEGELNTPKAVSDLTWETPSIDLSDLENSSKPVRTTTLEQVDTSVAVESHGNSQDAGPIDPSSAKRLAFHKQDTEQPPVGNYLFESVEIAGVAGVEHHDSNGSGETWIGSLKMDSMHQYRLVAHHISEAGAFERSVEFVGLYLVREDTIDFADESGRALFRMEYSMYSTEGRLFLNHDSKHGQAESGDIVGIVARHL